MKIALYHNLPPGGALRVVWEFARRRGPDVECDLFTLDFGDFDPFRYVASATQDFTGLVAHAHREPVDPGTWGSALSGRLQRLGMLRGVRRAEKEVARLINEAGYDAAYVHGCWFSQTPSLLRDLQVPTAYYMQEVRRATFEPGYRVRGPVSWRSAPGQAVEGVVEGTLRRRDKRSAQAPDLVLANSEFSADTIRTAYARQPEVAHLGIDEQTFTTDGEEPSREDQVLSVGGLERFKGHHLVVEAVGQLPAARRPSLHLVYERCDETYRAELLELADHLNVEFVEHRAISDQELARLFRQSRATVLAARREPFGLVALESMASGTPVVAYDEGGYRETVEHGVNGLRVTRETGLAAGLLDALATQWDPTKVRASVVPRWTWDASVAKQMEFLRSMMGAGT